MDKPSNRFVASALKHRPGRFQDVLAQDHVCRTLAHGLSLGRVANAYLFSGPRGTGKTSMARVLAKALNCESPEGVEPCGQCEQCRSIASGSHPDVLEIDAASNGGVEEIRDLRENVRFAPSIGKKKVYIIDEVHMTSIPAFNALLKTLEEPPPHATFILATTEVHKVPETILSRCQRFQMRRIPATVVVDRLREVLTKEGGVSFASEDERETVLYHIARTANGGLRDALVALDQVIAFAGESLKAKDVEDLLGVVDLEALHGLACGMWTGNLGHVVTTIGTLIDRGREPAQILRELVVLVRHAMVIKVTGGKDFIELPPEAVKELQGSTKNVSTDRLMMILDVLVEAEQRMRYSPEGRLVLEVACVKAGKLGETVSIQELLDRLGEDWAPSEPLQPRAPRTPVQKTAATEHPTAARTSPPAAERSESPPPPPTESQGNEKSNGKVVELPINTPPPDPAPTATADEPKQASPPSQPTGMASPTTKLERVQTAWRTLVEEGRDLPPLLHDGAAVASPIKLVDDKLVLAVPKDYEIALVPLQNKDYQGLLIRNLRDLVGETFRLEVKLLNEMTRDELPSTEVPPLKQEELEAQARAHKAVQRLLKHLPGEVLTVRPHSGGKRDV